MAAAILMMNIQGAVMAADKDSTISVTLTKCLLH